MPDEHLRFAPEILRRLGEELVPHADLGILELVRNAYDADATSCIVTLRTVDGAAEIVIEDNGDGMSEADIRSGWLLLGRSSKTASRFTKGGRRKVGEKGLGRLAALRLGRQVELTTRRQDLSGGGTTESSLIIDWSRFDNAEAVDDVPLTIQTRRSDLPPGTTIRVTRLLRPLSETDVRRLARSMVLLTGPFEASNTFRAVLSAPGFTEMEELVLNGYFDEHEYLIRANVRDDGRATAALVDWSGRVVASAAHSDLSSEGSVYLCPPADFELWVFTLSKASFDVRQSSQTVAAVQAWLREVGGVHLFQRGLRVHPYGDPGHDWLDMNLRRARSPELRPSTNTSIGRMTVNDDRDQLTPKTDRTGFIENDAFADLRRFGEDVLDWAAEVRLRIREEERQSERDLNRKAVKLASKKITETLDDVPASVRPKVQQALEEYQAAFDKQLKSTEDDLLLYRTLGTVGTVTAVFAHETLRPVATIQQMASSLQVRIRRVVDDTEYERTFAPPIDRIITSTASLRTFAEWPLHMLSRNKRRRRAVDLVRVAHDVLNTFSPYLADSEVRATVVSDDDRYLVAGTQASVEAIFANMLANSVHFLSQVANLSSREVLITVTSSGPQVVVTVADSGPGLVNIAPQDVWLPGRSTREEGTGLGLTIVRDAVRDMGGTISAVINGELGGAEFRVVFPRAHDERDPALPGLEER